MIRQSEMRKPISQLKDLFVSDIDFLGTKFWQK